MPPTVFSSDADGTKPNKTEFVERARERMLQDDKRAAAEARAT